MNKTIMMIGVAIAVAAGILATNEAEKSAEDSIPHATTSEDAPLPVARPNEISAEEESDNDQATTTGSAGRNASVGTIQRDAGLAYQGEEAESSVDEEHIDAPESFEPGVVTITTEERLADTKRDVPVAESFDYSKIQSLYVIKGDKGYAYEKFPTFLQYRDLITRKMSDAGESDIDFTTLIYEVRVVGIGEETTVYIGDSWIDDGERSAQLSDE